MKRLFSVRPVMLAYSCSVRCVSCQHECLVELLLPKHKWCIMHMDRQQPALLWIENNICF